MIYQVLDDDGHALDAHLEIEGKNIVFHSRGGTKGKNVQNADYSRGLRLLLQRIRDGKLGLETVWVDSRDVQKMPPEARRILVQAEAGAEPKQLFTLLGTRMKNLARRPGSKSTGGNTTKRLRMRLGTNLGLPQLVHELRVAPAVSPATGRLPAKAFEKVTAKHIRDAVQTLLVGKVQHPFDPSDKYDVLTKGGARLPPKAVFGVAATNALGFQVLPDHFSGGLNTVCFRKIEQAGYEIVRKGAETIEVPPGTPPEKKERMREEFLRDRRHVLQLKKRYRGRCQISGEMPLAGTAGDITEGHHIQWLTLGGVDGPDNIVIVSPDWHRAIHSTEARFDWGKLCFVIDGREVPLKLNKHLEPR